MKLQNCSFKFAGLDFADPPPWNCTCSTKGCAKQCDKCTAVWDSIHVICQSSPGYKKLVWYLHEQLWPLLAVAVVCATHLTVVLACQPGALDGYDILVHEIDVQACTEALQQ